MVVHTKFERKGRHSSQVLYGRATMFYCAEEAMTWVCVRLMKSTSSRGNKKKRKRKEWKAEKRNEGEKKVGEKRTIACCGRVRKQRLYL
jgi:hypothetical protein